MPILPQTHFRRRYMALVLAGFVWIACAGTNAASPATATTTDGAAKYVQPIDRARLDERIHSMSPATRRLVEMYMEAARRDVLSVTDGCFPDLDYRQHYRNLGERAKGAAVLSSIGSFWPAELRARCRK